MIFEVPSDYIIPQHLQSKLSDYCFCNKCDLILLHSQVLSGICYFPMCFIYIQYICWRDMIVKNSIIDFCEDVDLRFRLYFRLENL